MICTTTFMPTHQRGSAPVIMRVPLGAMNFKTADISLPAVADLDAVVISVRRDFCSKLREIGGK